MESIVSDASLARLNNFDGLRLTAAILVVIGHAFILTGAGAPPSPFATPVDTLGVYIFFSISGYLIAGSWESNPRVVRFFRHRVLRIFPALFAVVLVTVFVIGPLATSDTLAGYFGSAQTWNYLQGLALLVQYDLPGVFTSAVHARSAVNGSLWTLGVEFCCYILVAVVGLCAFRGRAVLFGVIAVIAASVVVANLWWPIPQGIFDASRVVPFFALGAVARSVVPRHSFAWRWMIAALLPTGVAALLWPGCALYLLWLVVPYSTIVIGTASTPVFRGLARFGDFSYGTYLWAFVLQQVELDAVGRISVALDVAIVLPGTLLVAWASWNVVERRALAHKDPREGTSRAQPRVVATR
jgi:peptidoglycan/LPS O-acetylase OafA/YrhL